MSEWKRLEKARREIVVHVLLESRARMARHQAELSAQGMHELGRRCGADVDAFNAALEELDWDTGGNKWWWYDKEEVNREGDDT